MNFNKVLAVLELTINRGLTHFMKYWLLANNKMLNFLGTQAMQEASIYLSLKQFVAHMATLHGFAKRICLVTVVSWAWHVFCILLLFGPKFLPLSVTNDHVMY